MTMASLIEREFDDCPTGHRLNFERTRYYDSEYALFYSHGRRSAIAVEPGPSRPPSKAWTRDAFCRMVVGDGGRRALSKSAGNLERLHRGRRYNIESFPIERYVELCEEEYVFGGLVDNLISTADSKPERFLNLVGNRWLGSAINRRNVAKEDVAGPLERADQAQAPLQLLLPAFPFKDQCAFRADVPAEHVDLGEVAFLVRLHCLVLAVHQIHNFDCECVVVADGTSYAQMLGVNQADALRYLGHLRSLRDRLNLTKSIHIVDLGALIERDDTYRRSLSHLSHQRIRSAIARQLMDLVASDADAARSFQTLAAGMRWNINTRDDCLNGGAPLDEVWQWLRGVPSQRASARTLDRYAEWSARARDAAIAYAAFNLAISHTGLLRRYFPDAVRLTTHAKPGHVMAPRIGSVFPWNGVAITDALTVGEIRASSIKSVELHAALRGRISPVFERNGLYPICYIEEGRAK